MSIRYKLLIAFSVIVLFATAVAVYGMHLVSNSSTLVVRLYDGPMMAVSHARAAQMQFAEARRAMERGLTLRDAAPPSNMALLDDSIKQFISDMKIVRERMPSASAEIDKIVALAEDWLRMGLTYLKPPAGGLMQLPLTSAVVAKGNDVMNAIDLAAENANAYGFDFRSQAESSARRRAPIC